MGIKGIFGEIGEGERVALSKLAVEKLEQENRPLRIAIDISIWHFQNQAGKGGSNPALRTLYYRLLRLLSLSIQPIFVFDGPNKPKFKRNKKVGSGAALPNFMAKQVIQYFGFPCHNAPGEAEAECALLQREGIVDAVLSEDVDTLMFGCGLTFRNWSSQSHSGAPTHVSMYKAEDTSKSGLDRSGMVLVAMMSGGDYIPEGIPRCGVKTACQAAKAGFGTELCRISKNNEAGLQAWKQKLIHEMRTNESKFFRNKHHTLKIPEEFPSREVLSYYTNPVVSKLEHIAKLKNDIKWGGDVDVVGLREFVAEAFEWTGIAGARKYIRGLAPALLVSKLLSSDFGDSSSTALKKVNLVQSITGQRAHLSTDGIPEFRLNFVPIDIVRIDLDAESDNSEEFGRNGLALNSDDDGDDNDQPDNNVSPRKRAASKFDPNALDKVWVPQTFAKYGMPLIVEDYEETLRNPKKPVRKPAKPRAVTKKGISSSMPRGALDGYFAMIKPGANAPPFTNESSSEFINESSSDKHLELPPAFLAPSLEASSREELATPKRSSRAKAAGTRVPAPTSKVTRSRGAKKVEMPSQANPWSRATSNTSLSISRHANEIATTISASHLKVPGGLDLLPGEPPRSFASGRTNYEVDDVESVGHIRNTGTTSRKRRDSSSPVRTVTPSYKKTAKLNSTQSISIDDQIKPLSSQRVLDFSPRISGSRDYGYALPKSSQMNSSFNTWTSEDVFSSPAKGLGSSSTESQASNPEVDSNVLVSTAFSDVKEREIIILDDSPPASPTPARTRRPKNSLTETNRNTNLGDRCAESPAQARLSPPKYDFTLSPTRPLPSPSKVKKAGRRYAMLRDSVPGSWKEVSESEIKGKECDAWKVDQIEVVDLSGD